MDNIIDQKVEEIRREVGSSKVILALSGGVDSSVTWRRSCTAPSATSSPACS
jgi:GMP synthase PP-ATPase subunit